MKLTYIDWEEKKKVTKSCLVFFNPRLTFGSHTNHCNILQSILVCVLLCTVVVTVKLLHFTAETRELECVGGS